MKKNISNNNNKDNNVNYLNGGGFGARPKTLLCTICGREFGTTSLEIHQKTCIKKYQIDLMNMDPGHRMQMPSTQQVIQNLEKQKQQRQIGTKGGVKQQQFISEQPQQVMALVACRKCGRRFNPDRIRKHESVCIGPEPDLSRIKQQQFEDNKRAARKLRPKKTGKWREEHLEFQQAMREMRKIRQQEISEGRGNPFGYQQKGYQQNGKQQVQQKYGNQQMNQKQYNNVSNRPTSQQKQQQQQHYTQSVKVTHKQPQNHIQKQQQQTPFVSSAQKYQQKYQAPQQKSNYGDKYDYGRPQNAGSGGNYQIAHSNVSTFSLFTNDGKPKNYDAYQQNNPYARKSGLY